MPCLFPNILFQHHSDDYKKEHSILVALAGGHLAFGMGLNAFICDITKPEDRSFRIGILYFAMSVGKPLGTQFGAYLYKTGGYNSVFGVTLGNNL